MIKVMNMVGTLALTTGISIVPITNKFVKYTNSNPYIRIINENENYDFYKDFIVKDEEDKENEELKISGKIPVILSKNNKVPFKWV